MGLDMYLYTNSKTLSKKVHKDAPYGDYVTDWYEKDGIVLYWRKANAIHKWFVENVQDGTDDCGSYKVSVEALTELHDICKRIVEECPLAEGKVKNGEIFKDGEWVPSIEDGQVMTNPELAEELLPTQHGFFFGSTDYDQWYYSDVKWTAEQLDIILGAIKEEGWHHIMPEEPDWYVSFYYESSW